MSSLDLEEAISQGKIFVDEIDVLNAVARGSLTQEEGERFSYTLESYAKATKSESSLTESDTPNSEGTFSETASWNRILVDEVDFIHAMEKGQIKKDDTHLCGIQLESGKSAIIDGDPENVTSSNEQPDGDEYFIDDDSSPDVSV